MIIEQQVFSEQEKLMQSIGNILHNLVGVKDWIFCIDDAEKSKLLYTSSTTSESLLGCFQELIKNNLLSLTQGNYLSLNNQGVAILILPICHENKLLGTIGLFNSVKSWGEAELSILESFVYQWGLFLNRLEPKKQEIENLLLCDVVAQVNLIVNCASSLEEIISAIITLTRKKLRLETIILLRMVEDKEVSCLFIKERIDRPSKLDSGDEQTTGSKDEKNCLNMALHLDKKMLGRLVIKMDNSRENLSKEEIDILDYIKSQLIILLEKMQEQQIKQEEDKGEYLSHIHHELRTPLVAILGFSRMLNEEIYGGLNPKQKQYIQGIVKSGEHLLDLVNGFLDISKIDAHQEELSYEKVEVEEICQNALCMVQPRCLEKGLDLNLDIDSKISFCPADQRRLKQILVNLLSNATKFTVTGSVTLQVKDQGDYILFSVIDTGIGINPLEQDKIFRPFGQIKNALNKKYEGTGLGLYLSRKLAQLHGGEITVVSQEGQGSNFTLHLPK